MGIYDAFCAVSESLLDYGVEDDQSKYGPVARQEREFRKLLEHQDFENYLISRLPKDRYATIKEIDGIKTIIIDTIEIPDAVLFEHQEEFIEAFSQMGGLAIEDTTGIAPSLDDASEVYDLNEARLPRQLLPVFEESLVLRGVERRKNLSRGIIYDWRGDIADNYSRSGRNPQDAQNLISLCSTGYFDEGELFDQMYNESVVQGDWSIQEYKRAIANYVKNNPFAVFVRADGMSAREVYHTTRGKIEEIDDFPRSPGYVEICGKGSAAHVIIDNARDLLSDNYDYNITTRHNQIIDQKILTVEP